ncbi:MAG TPA: aminopeptidase P family protein [Ferrovibrio sp.]|jgi:Xaa-Pro aminopeptidase|uniref:aminopeptidase P family protein n=1 Tax=Ferrovibrio sp. TaxID=1917215 RepID=UPI002B4AEB22|nr:aminopeptidase P family protein [Ferrovibrio sp.]HLT78442.1 aminopeptidase P family protein [Ferrovibrio sp.]
MTLPPTDLAALPAGLANHLLGVAAAPQVFGRFPGLDLLPDDLRKPRAEVETLVATLAERFAAAIENRDAIPERLARLRAVLEVRGLAGVIVPLTDEYQSEYVPLRAQRLSWLTGFTGSAGMAIVLRDRAAIWSDGRYTLQLDAQVDGALFERRHISDDPPTEWLKTALKAGDRLAYDPWLHTEDGVRRLTAACKAANAELVPAEQNPVDAAWDDQPPPPLGPVHVQDTALAGRPSEDKRREIAAAVKARGADAVVLTLPESIAWLLNIRGSDVPHTPLPLSMAVVGADASVDLYIDGRKLGSEVRKHLGDIRLHEPADFPAALDALGRAQKTVQVDPATTGVYVLQRLEKAGATLLRADDPCLLPKACKTEAELEGTRAAHRRDGAAVTRFLAWLDANAPSGQVDEIAAAVKLQSFRQLANELRDLSFTTISGAGPNGAIVHYRVTPETNRRLEPGSLYLVDSGGQYPDGTTDITRTVAIGQPSEEMRDRFTRVLKGHIALAMARFPEGTSGQQLDALARHYLWDIGLDYDHGTGHGVGSYLSVHEGPQRIAKLGSPVPLKPGMIVSNEPGYYKTGAYGIRIENLVAVRVEMEKAENGKRWLGFETLTRAPIDRRLIDLNLLTAREVAWLDAYHALVWHDIAPLVDDDTRDWLKQATAPLGA